MNKLLLSAALVAVVSATALAPRTASAVDGTITINGTINASTCKINGANSPAAVAVTLPTVSTTSLNAAGAVAGRTPFTLALTNCTGLTKATTFFEPGPTINTDGNLKNATGTATGVEVQLLNGADFSAINLSAASGSQNSTQATLTGGAANLTYYAQYYATAAAAAGTVATSVQFTMLYQ